MPKSQRAGGRRARRNRGEMMGEHGDPAGGLQGFALDKEFLSSPKGILMEAELVTRPLLDFLRCVSAAIVFTVVAFAVIAASHEGSAVSAFVSLSELLGDQVGRA
uniref:Uncharacterized protein n=1 Tax=Anolis carolinensis TaxID=28377 RepID=H9GTK1_ANOCA